MERATLITSVYMTLQLLRRTALVSPQDRWALTPPSHPYHNPGRHGGYFLLRYSTLADSFLLGSRMLCVARTFLIRRGASDRPTNCFCWAKIRLLCQRIQNLAEFFNFFWRMKRLFLFLFFFASGHNQCFIYFLSDPHQLRTCSVSIRLDLIRSWYGFGTALIRRWWVSF